MVVLLLFPAMAEALHLYEDDREGMESPLLLPPAGCKILKAKFESLFMGFLNTDRISSIISDSDIDDVR